LASPAVPVVCAAIGPDLCSFRCCFDPGVPDTARVSAIADVTILLSIVPCVPAVVDFPDIVGTLLFFSLPAVAGEPISAVACYIKLSVCSTVILLSIIFFFFKGLVAGCHSFCLF
jgi:hypothetical protein